MFLRDNLEFVIVIEFLIIGTLRNGLIQATKMMLFLTNLSLKPLQLFNDVK
jgi:hypothetical protein